ncbi:MAG: TraR/DksA C4-type zinc finger protein [Patescibacteria group bacterium]
MKTRFFEEMKSALADEKTKLEAELAGLAHRNPRPNEDGQTFVVQYENFGESEDENAAEIAQYGDNLSLEQELESALKDVESAMKAVESGTYGICKYCQQVISEDRLRARPTSTSCIACKKTLTQEL